MSRTYQGDFATAAVVRAFFNTVDASGAPATLSGSPAAAVYKDAGTTSSTAGVTLTVDFNSTTGLNLLAVDTSADPVFYAGGSDFAAVLTAGTAGGTSVVGRTPASFSLANRSALRPSTAGRTLNVSAAGAGDANVVDSNGQPVYNYDGLMQAASPTTVKFAATDLAGNSIPDDGRMAGNILRIVGGTGIDQTVVVGAWTGASYTYGVLTGTMPVQLDGTSQYAVIGYFSLDGITISTAGATRINGRQALNLMLAVLSSLSSGFSNVGASPGLYKDFDGTTRVSGNVDAYGNRSNIAITPIA